MGSAILYKLKLSCIYMLREVTEFTAEHAELVGMHFGDGSLIKRPGKNTLRFQLRGDAREDRDHYLNFIFPLCDKLIGYPYFGRSLSQIFDRKNNCFGLSIETTRLNSLFERLEIPIGPKTELYIPSWIKENTEFSKAFLRGFLDTDGTIYCGRNYSCRLPSKRHIRISLQLTSSSRNLMLEMSTLLENFKLSYFLQKLRPIGKQKSVVYRLCIYYKNVNKWFDLIGSHNPKHLTKYQIYRLFGACPPHTTLALRKRILKENLDPYIV